MITVISIIGAWLICTIAAERSAEAITTSVFFAPLRQFLARTALADEPDYINLTWFIAEYKFIKFICRWLSDLVSCGWCTSLWTSLFFALFLPGEYFSLNADNILVKIIALWGFANLWHSLFRLVHNGRVAAIDVNFRLVAEDIDIDKFGGVDGESRKGVSQEETIGVEPPTV